MMTHHQNDPPALVAVDWGTSRFRAWMMTKKGGLLSESHGPEGMLHCQSAGFEPVLRRHLKTLGAPEGLPVLICGMAGARQGWIEAPYLQTPTPLDDLQAGAVRVPVDGEIRILPGVAQKDRDRPEVMRGEETQILGVIHPGSPGLVCIPGTHSKWITLSQGALSAFTTYMTGEVFEILSRHSILQHAIDSSCEVSAEDAAFHAGLTQTIEQNIGLTALLFRLRASHLLGFSTLSSGASYLSGLLIGSELADVSRRFAKGGGVQLIASGKLAKLYETALTHWGFHVSLADAETASRQGVLKAAQRLWPLEV